PELGHRPLDRRRLCRELVISAPGTLGLSATTRLPAAGWATDCLAFPRPHRPPAHPALIRRLRGAYHGGLRLRAHALCGDLGRERITPEPSRLLAARGEAVGASRASARAASW